MYDAIVIGGGFFGCSLATFLKSPGARILVLEMAPDLLQRASYANQARVHNGYHYPRSLLTALRSRLNFPRFVRDYGECVVSDFEKYYAVGRQFSKVSARQFLQYFQRIGAEIEVVQEQRVRGLFNFDHIEEVFAVREYAFDAVKLKERVWSDLRQAEVEVRLNTRVTGLLPQPDGTIEVLTRSSNDAGEQRIAGRRVFNCTYAHINQVLGDSRLPLIPLKHEVTEMALIEMPDPLRSLGVTVMCGPFFSFMPFPPRQLHTLSHVRYTPHYYWQDQRDGSYTDAYQHLAAAPLRSSFTHMVKDVQRYVPSIAECRYVDSIWEVKTVLPQSEVDDSRPILLKANYAVPNLTCIMGGKIDNIYDVFAELETVRKEIQKDYARI